MSLNKIISFIWSRRAGKTFLTFQLTKDLIERKIIDIENVVYIDFSWILNKNIDLESIQNSYFELFPDKKSLFIFFNLE